MATIGVNLFLLDNSGKAGGTLQFIQGLLLTLHHIDQENDYILIVRPDMYMFWKKLFPKFVVTMVQQYGSEVYFNYSELGNGYFSKSKPKDLSFKRIKLILKNNFSIQQWIKKLWQYGCSLVWKQRRIYTTVQEIISLFQIQLWFCPMQQSAPLNLTIPVVIWIPDLQHLEHPEFFKDVDLARRILDYPISCSMASQIVTISEHSRQELIKHFNLKPSDIQVVYLACELKLADNVNVEQVCIKYNIFEPYLFYPANLWPHKNHQRLIQALAMYNEEGHQVVHLVMTGYPSNMDIEKEIQQKSQQYNWLHYLGYIDPTEVAVLLKKAKALIFPSLYEGFGMPVIEALQLGVPIAVSDIKTLREIAKNYAVYFDPTDVVSIKNAIHNVLTVSKQISEGQIYAQQFNGEQMANKFMKIWQDMTHVEVKKYPILSGFNVLEQGLGPLQWFFHVPCAQAIHIHGQLLSSSECCLKLEIDGEIILEQKIASFFKINHAFKQSLKEGIHFLHLAIGSASRLEQCIITQFSLIDEKLGKLEWTKLR